MKRTFILELVVDDYDSPPNLVHAVLPNVLEYSSAKKSIETGLFGGDDHLDVDVVSLRLLGEVTP